MEGESNSYFPPSLFPMQEQMNINPSSMLDQSMQNHPDQFLPLPSQNQNIDGFGQILLPVQNPVSQDGIVRRNIGKCGKKRRNKNVPARIAFHTRSSEDILDDGYKWRKYGQKSVKDSLHPRSYYRCTHHTCNVKKQIQRLSKDNSIVVTTYEGIHNHPCEKLMETLTPILRQLQFLSRF
ncbi:putative WRKY transcription factor 56-like [Dorcoceras hygrometricum]|uniref:Putative WRKY transcription factor 56-like n=1 Tax=Dorcoceras hygrometricum TaxID=472368 RepID=A0A2Z7A1R9_9LAMI|nr:putative WRKY transcription factor 56-like [Dorcoceras hygrometricum]